MGADGGLAKAATLAPRALSKAWASNQRSAVIEHDLPQLIEHAAGQWDLRRKQEQRFPAYKRTEVTDALALDLIIRRWTPRWCRSQRRWTCWRMAGSSYPEFIEGNA